MKNFINLLSLLFCFLGSFEIIQAQSTSTSSQGYTLQGKVTDQASGEPLLFGCVALFKNGVLIKGTETDLDGNYIFVIDSIGVYEVEVSYVGYQSTRIDGIVIKETRNLNNITKLDITLSEGVTLNTCVIVDYKEPLVEYCNTSSGSTVTAEQIRSLPTKNITAVAATVAGLKTKSWRKSKGGNFNRENYSKIVENKFHKTKKEPLSTFSIDVDRASYSNVRRFINNGSLPPADVVRLEEMINYFPYEYKQPEGDIPFAINHTLTECPWNSKSQILHIGIKGEEKTSEELPASNLVFLIDVSGSMSSDNKLGLVKTSLKLLVDNMRDIDKIALVVYAGAAGLVLDSTSGLHKNKIKAAIDNLKAGGSTAGGAGITLAYQVAKEHYIKKGNNRVILATDGDFNVGVSSDGDIVRLIEKKRDDNIFLSVLGYGMGNYQDSKMQQLADSGNGNHAYIDNLAEAKKTLVEEFGGTLFAIAKDVKIQIEFNPEFVKEYKLIGYENRMLEKEDFNDDKKDAGELGAGHTVTAFYEITPVSVRKDQSVAVDDLKYQSMLSAENTSDLATIKLRYKKPKGTKSMKIEEVISPQLKGEISSDVQFAMCVAEFGLLLRDSQAIKKGNYKNLLKKVKLLVEVGEEEYREEFIALIEKVIELGQMSEE